MGRIHADGFRHSTILVRERRLGLRVVQPTGLVLRSADWVAFRRGSVESPLVSLWKRDCIAFLGARAWDNRRFYSWHCLSAPWYATRSSSSVVARAFFCVPVCSEFLTHGSRNPMWRLEESLAVLSGGAGCWSGVKIHFWKFLKIYLFIFRYYIRIKKKSFQKKIITRLSHFIFIKKNEIGGYFFKNVQRVNLLKQWTRKT